MRKFFIYILIILLFASCDKRKPDLTTNARLVHTSDSSFADSTGNKLFKVDLSLKNNSKNDFLFWTLTCSWPVNWIIHPDNYYFIYDGCNDNRSTILKIKPNDSIVYHATIERKDENFINDDSIRFGLIIIDTNMYNMKRDHDFFQTVLNEKSKLDKVIWSNYLILY